MNKKHVGSNLADFLREEQLLHAVEATTVKRVIAFQIEREMKRRKLTKTEMANPSFFTISILGRAIEFPLVPRNK